VSTKNACPVIDLIAMRPNIMESKILVDSNASGFACPLGPVVAHLGEAARSLHVGA
jgi:hypothetical protein